MKLTSLITLLGFLVCGCSTFHFNEKENNNEYATDMDKNGTSTEPLQSSLQFQKQFRTKLTSKQDTDTKEHDLNSATQKALPSNAALHNINDYIEVLTDELVSNLKNVNSTTPVAIVSFVMLDSNYNQSSLLGNQIAESLIHEIHKYGIPVIDFKTTGYVRVTEQGDFAFSKDYEDFGSQLPADFVVGGTLLKHTEGYLVNARIIDFASKAVVATAQNFIPNDVANALLANSYTPDAKPGMPKIPQGNMVPLTNN